MIGVDSGNDFLRRFSIKAAFAIVLSFLLIVCFEVEGGETATMTFSVDFGKELGTVNPRIGFLGGLRDEFPDELIQPLNPALWRIGHQFRGRIKLGLTGAIERVEKFGAKYKLVMSDVINSTPAKGKDWKDFDWNKYESDVKKLVASTGERATSVIWEPANEPDCWAKHGSVEPYYILYGHAFKALREVNKDIAICGPSFAFPTYEKYQAFLNYCRENKLECNYVCYHYTGWDPSYPETAHWKFGKFHEFIKDYPEQKIMEIHCDEWGAGPDKPGRLQPGRAVIWFHYFENVYLVDRACRANWGGADDFVGGLVTAKGETYPAYHVYRWYAETKGQTRVETTGNSKVMALLASKSGGRKEILLGSVEKTSRAVILDLKGANLQNDVLTIHKLANTDLDKPVTQAEIPEFKEFTTENQADGLRIRLPKVEENESYLLVFSSK